MLYIVYRLEWTVLRARLPCLYEAGEDLDEFVGQGHFIGSEILELLEDETLLEDRVTVKLQGQVVSVMGPGIDTCTEHSLSS